MEETKTADAPEEKMHDAGGGTIGALLEPGRYMLMLVCQCHCGNPTLAGGIGPLLRGLAGTPVVIPCNSCGANPKYTPTPMSPRLAAHIPTQEETSRIIQPALAVPIPRGPQVMRRRR